MKLSWSPLLLLAATILQPITAQVTQGSYIIRSDRFPSSVLASPPSIALATSPAGWTQAQLPQPQETWTLNRFEIGWAISNKATGKYLSLVNNHIALDTKPFSWLVLEGPPLSQKGTFRIQDPRSRSAALALNDPSNGFLLSLEPYTEERTQHWSLQPVQ
ncbi:MAG: hypothetical protein JOS17DRAFT_756419 [Linnemannia elongata]|nr:MAG: hypothetical protein JOS17DRAFT_756419 [Linnemannia elongata]